MSDTTGGSSSVSLTTTVKVLAGTFNGNVGDIQNFNIKISAGAYSGGTWYAHDPEDEFNFANINQDKYVEMISVKKSPDDQTPPASITPDKIKFDFCWCKNTSNLAINWSRYDEVAQGDVVKYHIYYDTEDFTSVKGKNFAEVPAGIYTYEYKNMPEGQRYYFAITAVDEVPNENINVATASYLLERAIYTQSQMSNWDVKGDGRIGLEEAIRALQIVSGQEPVK